MRNKRKIKREPRRRSRIERKPKRREKNMLHLNMMKIKRWKCMKEYKMSLIMPKNKLRLSLLRRKLKQHQKLQLILQ